MAKHKIALIPGDGIGKETVPEGVRVLEPRRGASTSSSSSPISTGRAIACCRPAR
jgi:isocitrate/isopropylmalate dehydrogenase